jgi:hypothetical protein
MHHLLFRGLLVACTVLAASACGDDPIETPTVPTLPTITEVFSGTLTPNSGATHTFVSTSVGTLTATLKSVQPDNTVVMGFLIGTWNGSSCATVVAKDDATEASVLYGTVTGIGGLCVRVYDVGRFTEAVTYEVEVIHP